MKLLLLAEAAQLLRMSRSSLYQRRDIPRYRRPGSRVILFDQDELESWIRKGRIGSEKMELVSASRKSKEEIEPEGGHSTIDSPAEHVYHRDARYR